MTPAQLAEIRARCDAATEGEWLKGISVEGHHNVYLANGTDITEALGDTITEDDATFMAHAHQDTPNLLDYVAKLEADRMALLRQAVIALKLKRMFDAARVIQGVFKLSPNGVGGGAGMEPAENAPPRS